MRLRPPTADEADGVLAVLVARDVADVGRPDYTIGDLRDEWAATDFELSTDARVAELDGQLAGYAAVRRSGATVAVAPEFDGRGIDARLLRWAESRERERGRQVHRQWIATRNEHAAALMRAAGYTLVRSYWRMVLQLARRRQPSAPPAGIALRPLDPDGDALAIHAVDLASFSGAGDYEPMSPEAFRDEHLHAHDLDASLSLVAETGGTIAGFLLARRWDREAAAYVDVLAVHPDRQRAGVGAALLHAAFAGFAAAGLAEAQLGVASDNPRALRLYERVGMKPRFQVDTYERPVAENESGRASGSL